VLASSADTRTQFVSEDMQMLWSSDMYVDSKNVRFKLTSRLRPYNTLHVEDFASAIYRLAQWMQEIGHEKALELAGSPLPPCRPIASFVRWLSGKKTETSEYDNQDLDFLAMRTETVDAPVFNIVDENQTTMGQLTQAIAKAVGVKYSFTNTLLNQFAKLNMETVVEEANEHHLEKWPLMLEKSVPQITTPVLTPQIVSTSVSFAFRCFKGSKSLASSWPSMRQRLMGPRSSASSDGKRNIPSCRKRASKPFIRAGSKRKACGQRLRRSRVNEASSNEEFFSFLLFNTAHFTISTL
jgi:hypothetical protein